MEATTRTLDLAEEASKFSIPRMKKKYYFIAAWQFPVAGETDTQKYLPSPLNPKNFSKIDVTQH